MLLLWNETGYLINVNDNAGAVWNYCNVPQGNSIDDELLVRLSANLKLNPINNPFND
jgi:putative hemolysin